MFKRNKVRVVPKTEFTDYTEREKKFNELKFATRRDVAIMAAVPTVGAVGLFSYSKAKTATKETLTQETVTAESITPTVEHVSTVSYQINPVPDTPPVMSQPEIMTGDIMQTGYIADKSLEMLATILDPFIQIMVAISFPIASVIMVGACFFFMIGNQEKAWTMIMNSALGYILIQLSPLFLEILKTLGNTV